MPLISCVYFGSVVHHILVPHVWNLLLLPLWTFWAFLCLYLTDGSLEAGWKQREKGTHGMQPGALRLRGMHLL